MPVARRHRKKAKAPVLRAALIAFTSVAVSAPPLGVTWHGACPELAWHSAAADEKGGEGKGGEGKGGEGRGGGHGKGGGEKGKGDKKGGAVSSRGAGTSLRRIGPASPTGSGTVEVVHANGMRETIRAGRYLMKDGKGRTIVERAATNADLSRLRNLKG